MTKVQYRTDKGRARKAMRQDFIAAYDALTSGWSALDQAGKQQAIRTGLIVCMKAIRWLVTTR